MKGASKSRRALMLTFDNNTSKSSSYVHHHHSIFNSNNNKVNQRLPILCYCRNNHYSTLLSHPIQELNFNTLTQSFKNWFKTQNCVVFDRVFLILSKQDQVDDFALSQLGLRLSEALVLDVLDYGSHKNEVISCLKFFDWAGRQLGFHHTRATYYAIFRILSRAKLKSLMFDFLDQYGKFRFIHGKHGFGFYKTLVLGYSIAGKPQLALQIFGQMRFRGLDLDDFTYNVLLNALVEDSSFEAVDAIARQISFRGFDSPIKHKILVKSFCKQKMLDEAEEYLRSVIERGETDNGAALGVLVYAFCSKSMFEKARQLIEEFRESGVSPMEPVYGAWIHNLVRSNKVDEALEFLQRKNLLEGYVPEVCRYNDLLFRLLKEDRLKEAFDLLMEMKESGISPHKVTMNAALCVFCKAGMVDVALELYNCKSEFGLSPSVMACNYLINSLCREGNTDEAYRVLKNSAEKNYFPGKRTFSLLADSVCREGKLDMLKELIHTAQERNFMPGDFMYEKYISALCRARKLEEGYLIYGKLIQMNGVAAKSGYLSLIHGFNKLTKGDIAARLLIEMQDKGHFATRSLFRAVIRSLCDMENPESQFFKLLEMQLSRHGSSCCIYNFFIDGAGHAKKPDFAREVFEIMQGNGIVPTLHSDILMLQSYLKSERISDALNFFNFLPTRRKIGRKLYHTMVVGLCKANRVDFALSFFEKMRSNGMVPSVECYEVLIMLLCADKRYKTAINLIIDFEKTGRRVTSFIGNTLLRHSFQSDELYNAWLHVEEEQNEVSNALRVLGQIIGAFSGRLIVSKQVENLEEVIEQCFPLDLYTYNMLLRRLSINNIDDACKFFNTIRQKGYEPNRWTYDIIVHGLFKHRRTEEARKRATEMFSRGFEPTDGTKQLM